MKNYLKEELHKQHIEHSLSDEVLEKISEIIYYSGVLDGGMDSSVLRKALEYFSENDVDTETDLTPPNSPKPCICSRKFK